MISFQRWFRTRSQTTHPLTLALDSCPPNTKGANNTADKWLLVIARRDATCTSEAHPGGGERRGTTVQGQMSQRDRSLYQVTPSFAGHAPFVILEFTGASFSPFPSPPLNPWGRTAGGNPISLASASTAHGTAGPSRPPPHFPSHVPSALCPSQSSPFPCVMLKTRTKTKATSLYGISR